jgi:thiol:disulfide interchange protein DsbD
MECRNYKVLEEICLVNFIKKWLLLLTTLTFIFGHSLHGEALPSPTEATLVAEDNSIQPGRPFWVAVHLRLAPDWHAYWKNPGDAGMPVQVDWDLPQNFTVSELEWPYPKKMELSGIVGFGYDDELTLLAKITPDVSTHPDQKVDLGAKVRWLSCSKDECVPGNAKLSLPLPVSLQEPTPNAENTALFSNARENIPELPGAVLVSRDNDKLNLFVTLDHLTDENSKDVKLEFYPETKKLVDHHHDEGTLAADGTAMLALTELKKSTSLKGLLIAKQGETTRAFHVDAPINLSNASLQPIQNAATEESSIFSFAKILALAFIGGLILNLMPCVLPVISFKVLSFIKMAGENRATTTKHGIAFSVGVLISFWVLAGLLIVLRAYGSTVGWGFHLQEPLFVGILACVMFLLSLNLLGVFEFGLTLSSWAGQVEQTARKEAPEGLLSSFSSGVLATTLATPCSGPFLGLTIGLAATLPVFQSLLIFTSVGLGMASPYLILGIFPALLSFLPKPGAWMEVFKQGMGIFLLASVIWLLWVFAGQTSELSIFLLLGALYVLAIAAWIYGLFGSPVRSRKVRLIGSLAALILVSGAYQLVQTGSQMVSSSTSNNEIASNWEPYSAARVEELQKAGIPVIVDFTAKWCLICQVNHVVLANDKVSSKLDEIGAVRMIADWTLNDPEITEALTKFGRNSVPLYLLYGSEQGTQPTILPQVLTPDVVLEELEKIPTPDGEQEAV